MSTVADLSRLIVRELQTLRDELLAYPDDAHLWALPPGLPNSAGTLTLHLVGNLRWYIGAQYGSTGYVRDRDLEFAARDVPRAELLRLVSLAVDEVTRTFASFDERLLAETYPLEVGGLRPRTGIFFQHLASHLAYHLGQVDYHRRMVTGSKLSVGALPIVPLMDP